MVKLIFRLLIIVIFCVSNIAFAGNSGSKMSPPDEAMSCQVEVAPDEEPVTLHQVVEPAKCGKVCSALAAVGGFYHRHSDLISRTCILALDAVYFAGTFFPEYIPPNVTYVSYTLLSYIGLIGLPFVVRETAKAVADTKYARKRKCNEVVAVGAIRTVNNSLSVTGLVAYSAAATLLNFEGTYDRGMAIYGYLSPLGFASLLLNPALDLYQFYATPKIIRELERDRTSQRIMKQIDLLACPEDETEPDPETRLSALVRARMDVVSLVDLLNRIRRLRPDKQTPLLSMDAESQDNPEVLYTFIIDSIRLQSKFAIGDLILNILFDVEMGVGKVLGPGKYQACTNLATAVAYDSILGVKKCKQARNRARLQTSMQESVGSNEIVVFDTPSEQGARYAFLVARNTAIPIEIRVAAVQGCTPEDSLSIVAKRGYDRRIRSAAIQNCNKGQIISLFRSEAKIAESIEVLGDGPLIPDGTIICTDGRERPISMGDSLLASYGGSQTGDMSFYFICMTQYELYKIASDPKANLDIRIGAAFLLQDSDRQMRQKVIIVQGQQ